MVIGGVAGASGNFQDAVATGERLMGVHEFQMLLGVAERLRAELVAGGHRMRVYVPYGTAWYDYAVRRLKENPSIAGHVARDVLRSPLSFW